MQEYLNKPIKEIITEFPQVGEVLDEYNIGCVPCHVGSCLLKDIVEIHNLSEEDEKHLLVKVAEVIYPGQEIEIPALERKTKAKPGEIKYSPPIKRLVDEHTHIMKLVTLMPGIVKALEQHSEKTYEIVKKSIDFIRFYADKYHHAKEEEILFKYFDENLDIIKVIREDHETARGHVRAVLEAMNKKETDTIAKHLNEYQELLAEHIKKENEILYPWMDRNLSLTQVGELFTKFDEADKRSDEKIIENNIRFVEELEKSLKR